jgi:hypothetical protein
VKRPLPPPPPSFRKASPAPTLITRTLPKAPQPPRPPERPTLFPPVEAPTPTKNQDIALYQGLLSVFDEMSHEERLGFVELALLFKELDVPGRARILEEANRIRGRK